jgi:hypothetical protein
MEGPWAKHVGLKRGDIENTLGEHIGNLMGTYLFKGGFICENLNILVVG